MFLHFLDELRAAGIPASLKEHLVLLEALDQEVIERTPEDFYYLARAIYVKDEGLIDRFDQVFGRVFRGLLTNYGTQAQEVPADWLKAIAKRYLSPEEMERIKSLGSWDEIMETLKQRLEEQHERHQGGNKWIGTGGTSPFGNGGYNPEGVRIGGEDRHGRAIKVWEQREFRNLDNTRELGTRNIKVALRRLRRFARQGAAEELALDDTIRATASNAGYLDIRMQPERKNRIKVVMLLDVGGSMDDHIERVEELFSAARSEFKNMEFYYFHNCVYDYLWKNNRRRHSERFPTWDVLRKYPADTCILFVGDATMSPYEVLAPGGSVEYNNEEAGAAWLARFTSAFPKFAWLNPEPEHLWEYRQSIAVIRQIMNHRMFPITLEGLERAMRLLSK